MAYNRSDQQNNQQPVKLKIKMRTPKTAHMLPDTYRALRKSIGTRERVAFLLDVTTATISAREFGRSPVTKEAMIALREIFRIVTAENAQRKADERSKPDLTNAPEETEKPETIEAKDYMTPAEITSAAKIDPENVPF